MSDIRFNADAVDPSVGTTVYGKGHQSSAITDEVQITVWRNQGRVELLGAPPRNVGVTALGTTTATISYIIDQTVTSNAVEYGTTTAYGSTAVGSPATGAGACSAAITGLTTATIYHFRVRVVSPGGTVWTPDMTFKTN